LTIKNNRPDNPTLSSSNIARYCQVSRSTVLKWIKDGKLQAFKLPGGHYRVDREDFREFLKRYNIPIKDWLFESESMKERR
jgi:excisionase family DNA binding protein